MIIKLEGRHSYRRSAARRSLGCAPHRPGCVPSGSWALSRLSTGSPLLISVRSWWAVAVASCIVHENSRRFSVICVTVVHKSPTATKQPNGLGK
jgi:hypothetical protein